MAAAANDTLHLFLNYHHFTSLSLRRKCVTAPSSQDSFNLNGQPLGDSSGAGTAPRVSDLGKRLRHAFFIISILNSRAEATLMCAAGLYMPVTVGATMVGATSNWLLGNV
jgi:hypothetical protein